MASKVQRKTTKPYCTCLGGMKGWSKHPGPNDYWVHPTCGKVSRLVYRQHGGIPLQYFP